MYQLSSFVKSMEEDVAGEAERLLLAKLGGCPAERDTEEQTTRMLRTD
jgi:hypothetical protein